MVSSAQEIHIGVGAVDSDVTSRAVLEARIGHIVGTRLRHDALTVPAEVSGAVMALQAKGEHYGPL